MTQSVPVPVPPPAKPSRRKRLWKWTKRLFALFAALVVIAAIVYSIHRQIAFESGRGSLAAARAELDAKEPGWRYEEIEAVHIASLPAPDRNSAKVVLKLPEAKSYGPMQRATLEGILERNSYEQLPDDVLAICREVATELPADHPALRELARSTVGGLPMVESVLIPNPSWKALQDVSDRIVPLPVVALSAATAKDYKSNLTYIHAMLNASRAIGSMPRYLAQGRRNAHARNAASMVLAMLALGAPAEGLAELQREFLVEADRDWMKATLRGERAAWHRAAPTMSRDDFYRSMLLSPAKATWEDELLFRAINPYRDECLAMALRSITKAIADCDRPPADRIRQWVADDEAERRDRGGVPLHLVRFWEREFLQSTRILLDRDFETQLVLRHAVVAIGIERFRQSSKRWPKTLDEIPNDMMPIAPLDLFDGKPLNYRIVEEGIELQLNGPPFVNYRHENLIPKTRVQLWNVELRGQKPPVRADDIP